jgi:hypothetical protein
MTCGRCSTPRCEAHALPPGQRCPRCERDYAEEATTRRSAKLIFAPPLAILVGGALFGALVPVGAGIGGIMMLAFVACAASVGSGAGACRIVDRNARALFLRERSGGLPAARLLPPRSHS